MGVENHSESGNTGGAPVDYGTWTSTIPTLVDHIAKVDWSLLSQIPGERGGSFPVVEELKHILNELNAHILPSTDNESLLKTIAGGSVANTIRGLAAGFGISCGIIGACGKDPVLYAML
ncbi:hypothetical protein RND71_016499 [Anisodus tanguticus]|uniref:Carbohydrate kinase PfkB domain-containing protein n=1 Tax=Anisodus tanguticus TaxID=243964 RepID=A0AAE1VIM4_9SOLA|nr:hypothetical protein RND71_016499 [Anisodus tanguticus]